MGPIERVRWIFAKEGGGLDLSTMQRVEPKRRPLRKLRITAVDAAKWLREHWRRHWMHYVGYALVYYTAVGMRDRPAEADVSRADDRQRVQRQSDMPAERVGGPCQIPLRCD